MRIKTVFFKLGLIILIVGVAMLFPMFVSVYYMEHIWKSFFVSSLLTVVFGTVLALFTKSDESIRAREGFAIVSLGWVFASIFGSLPYLLSGTFIGFSDAFFETVSGFTTTGATVMVNVETSFKGILFWRSLTQWLGGMGIVILFVALLSTIGSDAIKIFKAELPNPTFEKIKPRLNETARILWITYIGLTFILFISLWLCGMSLFDSINHSFTTISTGGFSTRDGNIGAFSSQNIQLVITLFMFMGGINFALYYQALKSKSLLSFWKNDAFKTYLIIILVFTLMITGNLLFTGRKPHLLDVAFQVVSLTSTGFSSVELEMWPAFSQMLLISLMFIGASAGSTSGSIKVDRYAIMLKCALIELKRLSHPRSIISVKINKQSLSQDTVIGVFQFFFLYLAIAFFGVLILGLLNVELPAAITAVAASLSNVGTGLAMVAKDGSFYYLSTPVKLTLAFYMLLGRLEIYTLLVLLLPNTWRK